MYRDRCPVQVGIITLQILICALVRVTPPDLQVMQVHGGAGDPCRCCNNSLGKRRKTIGSAAIAVVTCFNAGFGRYAKHPFPLVVCEACAKVAIRAVSLARWSSAPFRDYQFSDGSGTKATQLESLIEHAGKNLRTALNDVVTANSSGLIWSNFELLQESTAGSNSPDLPPDAGPAEPSPEPPSEPTSEPPSEPTLEPTFEPSPEPSPEPPPEPDGAMERAPTDPGEVYNTCFCAVVMILHTPLSAECECVCV